MKKMLLGALGAVALMATAPAPSFAAPTFAGALQQTAAPYRFTVGDAEIIAFSDCTIPINMHGALGGLTDAELDALLAANFQTNPMDTPFNVFLVERGGRTILVDTGGGDLVGAGACGRTFDGLAVAGVRPDQITDILITHLHLDHIGGLVRKGQRRFPNAVVHLAKPELDYYVNPPAQQDPRSHATSGAVLSMIKPYVDAGKVQTFDRSGEILAGISGRILPGHTPGSTVYTLTSGDQALVFIGDYNPIAVIGLDRPDVTFITDQDAAKSRDIRKQLLEEFSHSGALIAAPHLSFPGVGHFGSDGGKFRWFPIDYKNRDPNMAAPKF